MSKLRIPFNRPTLTGSELQYIEQAYAAGHLSGDGPFTRRSSKVLEEILGVPRVLLTTSCSHALEMCALLLDLRPGDEVLVPSFAFVTTVSSFALHGAKPIFVDVRPDTLNIDAEQVVRSLTPRTRAIVALHYAGVGCELDDLLSIVSARGLQLIEDNAHGLFGTFRGKLLGTFGSLATLSFHETKNLTCGEGGALVINDTSLIARAEILREKGTDRSRFFRGEVDKYTWVDIGSSYLPSEILAAFLYAQLEKRASIQAARARVHGRYAAALAGWAKEHAVGLPFAPAHCQHPFHMYYLMLPSLDSRQALIAKLRERGILAVFHYLPLHLSAVGRRFGGRPGDCPVTERVSDRLLRLPFYNSLSEPDQDQVIETILDFRP